MEYIFSPKILSPDHDQWQQPANVGNSGGGNPAVPHGTYTLGLDEEGNLSVYVVPVVSTPWDTFYFFQPMGSYPRVSLLAQRFAFTFPTQADLDNCGAFEWQVQQVVSGTVWNCGWQIRLDHSSSPAKGQLYTFDYKSGQWIIVPGLTFNPSPGQSITISTEHMLSSKFSMHEALWINGKRYPVSISRPAVPNVYPGQTRLDVAFQIDSIKQALPIRVVISDMKVGIKEMPE